MSLKDFLKECNTRGIFKMLSIYIVSSWVILQVLALVNEPLGLPEKSVTYLILLLLFCFPIYILYLWKSRVRHSKSEANTDIETSIQNEVNFKHKYFISLGVITLLSFASVALIISNTFTDGLNLPEFSETNKIAVLNFDNNSNDASLDFIGEMAADWLINGITENLTGEVISSDVVKDYSNMLGVQMSPEEIKSIFNKFLNPNKVVSGNIFLQDSILIVRCSVKDGLGNKTFITFPQVTCAVDNPLACIQELQENVLTFLAVDDKTKISLEETPPKFQAYQKVLEAKSKYDNIDEYYKLINEAIEIDSNYFEPKSLLILHYYNEGDSKTSDSLIKDLVADIKISRKQRNNINLLEALVEGKHRKAFYYQEFEYNIMPFDLITNAARIAMANQFINRPDMVEEIFNEISMDEMLLDNCYFCKSRYFQMAMAYNELGDFKKSIDLLEPIVYDAEYLFIYRALISAYVKSDNIENLKEFFSKLELQNDESEMNGLNLYAGKRFLLVGDKSTANIYFDKLINGNNVLDIDLANAYYFKEDYENAEEKFLILNKNNPSNTDIIAKLAVCLFKNNKKDQAKTTINTLSQLRGEYQYGSIDYAWAIYSASIGQEANAIQHLLSSIAQGNYYVPGSFHNDTHFQSIKDSPEFQKVLTYWH